MDTNTMIVLIVAFFVIIVVVGFIIYRHKAKVGVEVPGGKLNFEASNDSTTPVSNHSSQPKSGIFRNWSIGKTRVEIKGSDTSIADNVSIGDTELTTDSSSPTPPTDKPHSKHK